MLRVGLTGGIACGKTVVARRLAGAGVPVLDLDRLAHEVMAPGEPAHREVVAAFGEGILDATGRIHRPRLGAIVFADAGARERLNAIVHPRVREAEASRAEGLRAAGTPLLVTEAALLVEAGLHLRFDRLVVVVCPPEVQLARLQERDGLDAAAARARVAAQMPLDVKRSFAHEVIDTDGPRERTQEAADRLREGLLRSAAAPVPGVGGDRRRARGGLSEAAAGGPRGLTAAALADHLAEAGGLDLVRLARRLAPASDRPWYELGGQAEGGEAEVGAAGVAAPLALHELCRHGFDEARLAAAAHSLSWLLERGETQAADAVLSVLAVAEAFAGGAPGPGFEASVAARFERAGRTFSRGEPSRALWSALRCAGAAVRGVEAARREAAAQGADVSLVGVLVGLGQGRDEESGGRFERFLDAL